MLAKKRLPSACETAGRAKRLDGGPPSGRNMLKVIVGGNRNVVVQRLFPGSRP